MTKLTDKDRLKVSRIIDEFNQDIFQGQKDIEYFATFRANFVYIHRLDPEREEPISRIKFSGDFDNWEFAIYKWSSESYDPNEFFFPGREKFDGTVLGALKAGHEAYPPHWSPKGADIISFISQMFNRRK